MCEKRRNGGLGGWKGLEKWRGARRNGEIKKRVQKNLKREKMPGGKEK